MFECHLVQGSVLRKVMEAISALVDNANVECSSSGESGLFYHECISFSELSLSHFVVSRAQHASDGYQQCLPRSDGTQL